MKKLLPKSKRDSIGYKKLSLKHEMDGSRYKIFLWVRGVESIYTHCPFKKLAASLHLLDGSRKWHRPRLAKNLWDISRRTMPGVLDTDILKERKVCVNYATKYGKTYKSPQKFVQQKIDCSTHLKCWVVRRKRSNLPQSIIKNSQKSLESMVQDI